MDFHGGSKLSKLTYPIKTIYSKEARVQLRKVLDDFKPDVCHLNNFNYQLTPSIILEIVKWRKETGRDCKIIFTAHDYQLVCPNHMLNNPNMHQNCEKCLGGHFVNCMKGKCIHGSTAKSAIGMMEAEFWKWKGTYKYIDTMICCSEFMKSKMDSNPLFATKTVAMHNFIDKVEWKETEKKDYVLYFGRFSEEKGIGTLIKVCKDARYKIVYEAGYDAMIYSNMLWEAYELDLEKLSDYPVWYADYEELPQTPYRFSMWQYSSTGSVPGIEGNVDLNIQLLKK